MGWLPWSSSDPKNTASDGGRIAPDRSSRQKCWEGRDLFFSCLDDNDIVDSIKEDKEARRKCGKEIAEFESACAKAWVCAVSQFLQSYEASVAVPLL
jgi:cytochrome c oxidase assembly factor 6